MQGLARRTTRRGERLFCTASKGADLVAKSRVAPSAWVPSLAVFENPALYAFLFVRGSRLAIGEQKDFTAVGIDLHNGSFVEERMTLVRREPPATRPEIEKLAGAARCYGIVSFRRGGFLTGEVWTNAEDLPVHVVLRIGKRTWRAILETTEPASDKK